MLILIHYVLNLCLQNGIVYPVSIIGDLQSLLLAVMLNVARNFLSKKSLEPVIADQSEQKQKCCFLSAAIAFCKLQHLNSTIPVKTQVTSPFCPLVLISSFSSQAFF